jgi:hypothetical protein
MKYRFSLQKRRNVWLYVMCFGKDTPTEIADVEAYSDRQVSAKDAYDARHFVYSKGSFLVAIVLYDALRLFPYLNPELPETLRMPGMHAIQFGKPPVPTLLLRFREQLPDNNTAYAIAPDVHLIFQGPELAMLYVCDVYKNIAEVA